MNLENLKKIEVKDIALKNKRVKVINLNPQRKGSEDYYNPVENYQNEDDFFRVYGHYPGAEYAYGGGRHPID